MLVVDDYPDAADMLARVLRLKGVPEIQCATSAARAHQVLEAGFRPDAVVLDLLLGSEDGAVLARQLRSDARFSSVSIVALSGDVAALERAGAVVDRCLLKPVDPDSLVLALQRNPAAGG